MGAGFAATPAGRLIFILLFKHIARKQHLLPRIVRKISTVPTLERILHHIVTGAISKQPVVLEVVHRRRCPRVGVFHLAVIDDDVGGIDNLWLNVFDSLVAENDQRRDFVPSDETSELTDFVPFPVRFAEDPIQGSPASNDNLASSSSTGPALHSIASVPSIELLANVSAPSFRIMG